MDWILQCGLFTLLEWRLQPLYDVIRLIAYAVLYSLLLQTYLKAFRKQHLDQYGCKQHIRKVVITLQFPDACWSSLVTWLLEHLASLSKETATMSIVAWYHGPRLPWRWSWSNTMIKNMQTLKVSIKPHLIDFSSGSTVGITRSSNVPAAVTIQAGISKPHLRRKSQISWT